MTNPNRRHRSLVASGPGARRSRRQVGEIHPPRRASGTNQDATASDSATSKRPRCLPVQFTELNIQFSELNCGFSY